MTRVLLSALFVITVPINAQLLAPNNAGVSAGHDVLRAKNVDTANEFWKALGGEPVQFAGRLNLIKFPGVLLLEIGGGPRQGAVNPVPPPGDLAGSEGSSLEFLGFSV